MKITLLLAVVAVICATANCETEASSTTRLSAGIQEHDVINDAVNDVANDEHLIQENDEEQAASLDELDDERDADEGIEDAEQQDLQASDEEEDEHEIEELEDELREKRRALFWRRRRCKCTKDKNGDSTCKCQRRTRRLSKFWKKLKKAGGKIKEKAKKLKEKMKEKSKKLKEKMKEKGKKLKEKIKAKAKKLKEKAKEAGKNVTDGFKKAGKKIKEALGDEQADNSATTQEYNKDQNDDYEDLMEQVKQELQEDENEVNDEDIEFSPRRQRNDPGWRRGFRKIGRGFRKVGGFATNIGGQILTRKAVTAGFLGLGDEQTQDTTNEAHRRQRNDPGWRRGFRKIGGFAKNIGKQIVTTKLVTAGAAALGDEQTKDAINEVIDNEQEDNEVDDEEIELTTDRRQNDPRAWRRVSKAWKRATKRKTVRGIVGQVENKGKGVINGHVNRWISRVGDEPAKDANNGGEEKKDTTKSLPKVQPAAQKEEKDEAKQEKQSADSEPFKGYPKKIPTLDLVPPKKIPSLELPSCKKCLKVSPIEKYQDSLKNILRTHEGRYVFTANFKDDSVTKDAVAAFIFEVVDVLMKPAGSEAVKTGSKVVLRMDFSHCKCPVRNLKEGVYILTGDVQNGGISLDSDLVQLIHA